MTRITYADADGLRVSGVAALARALERINLGWALLGWLLMTPGISYLVQLCVDTFAGRLEAAGPTDSTE